MTRMIPREVTRKIGGFAGTGGQGPQLTDAEEETETGVAPAADGRLKSPS